MNRNNRKVKSFKRRRLLKVLAGVLLIALIAAGILFARSRDDKRLADTSADTDQTSNINYEPPTEEEIQATNENKEKILDEQPATPAQAPDGRQKVTPIIASASSSGASAYITGVFEEGGTCTATFTHGNDKVSVTSKGFGNSNYTSCEPLNLNSPLNISGDWDVVVSYSSTTSTGASQPVKIKVN